jgi:hypothetical protein
LTGTPCVWRQVVTGGGGEQLERLELLIQAQLSEVLAEEFFFASRGQAEATSDR